jgi:hypothetical protein
VKQSGYYLKAFPNFEENRGLKKVTGYFLIQPVCSLLSYSCITLNIPEFPDRNYLSFGG